MKKLLVVFAAATLLFSCKKEIKQPRTFEGEKVELHNGNAWSWLKVDESGAPKELGISIDNAAMNSLPTEAGEPGHNHDNSIVLPLHAKALEKTLFKFIGLDWAPQGHEPQNIYTLPHFDLHYYMVPQAEVEAAVDMTKMMISPAADFLPANHVPGPPIPKMGLHWLDVTSPELHPTNPAPFTQTFIYGSYDGKVTFYEPMITRQFLMDTENFERPIPQPTKVQTPGYYPTKMRVKKEGNKTSIILEAFVNRQA